MQMAAPNKKLIVAPTAGNSATCKSCAHCPWMAMNGLQNLLNSLQTGQGEVLVDHVIAQKAKTCIDRMLDFAAQKNANIRPSALLENEQQLFSGIGPA
jgi:quinolinate synthase